MISLVSSIITRCFYERRLENARSTWAEKYAAAQESGDDHAAKMASLWLNYLDDVMVDIR